jgi:hypothetical protein
MKAAGDDEDPEYLETVIEQKEVEIYSSPKANLKFPVEESKKCDQMSESKTEHNLPHQSPRSSFLPMAQNYKSS